MSRIFVGVDPGLSGCLCAVAPYATAFYDAPVVVRTKGKSKKREYDLAALAGIVKEIIGTGDEVTAALEWVHSMPHDGGMQSFTFGRGFGYWEMAMAAYDVPYVLVTPQEWLRGIGAPGDKGERRLWVSRLHPVLYRNQMSRMKDEGRIDAFLIATWLQMQHEGYGAYQGAAVKARPTLRERLAAK